MPNSILRCERTKFLKKFESKSQQKFICDIVFNDVKELSS